MQKVNHTTCLTNTMHSKHRRAYIYSLKASFSSHHRADCWAACWVILYNEILNWYTSIFCGKFGYLSYNWGADAVCHISLVSISFNYDSFMYSWSVLRMMFFRVVRMHPMRHVCWQHKAFTYRSIIVLHLSLTPIDAIMNPLSYLCSHIRISPLSRLRPNFFMIKEHNHIDTGLIVISLFN